MADDSIPQERRDFYVYVIFRLSGVPCYVGKGRGARWRTHPYSTHNSHLRNIFKKEGAGLPVVKVREGLSCEEAFDVERALIAVIGRRGTRTGPLVNRTAGGDGLSGIDADVSSRLSASLKASYEKGERQRPTGISPGMLEAARAANTGRQLSKAHRDAIGTAQRGVPKTAEHIAKFSESLRGRKLSPEHRANVSASLKGKPHHWGAALSAALKGKAKSPEAVIASVTAKKLARERRAAAGIKMTWWHRPDGSGYIAPAPKHPDDKIGTGRPAPKNFAGCCRGRVWWTTMDGKHYRATDARCDQDTRGRSGKVE